MPEADIVDRDVSRQQSAKSWRPTGRKIRLRSSFPQYARFAENLRFDRGAVVQCRVLLKGVEASGNNGAALSNVEKNILRIVRRAFKPVRIVKCPAIDTDHIGEALELEKKFRSASRTKIDRYQFTATLGTVFVFCWCPCQDFQIVTIKDRFHQIGRTSGALAKPAVAKGDADWLRIDGISVVSAKATT